MSDDGATPTRPEASRSSAGLVARSVLGLVWFAFWFFACFPALVLWLSGQRAALVWTPSSSLGAFLILSSVVIVAVSTASFVRRAHGTPVPLDPPRIFVSTGLYRWVRNPMYLAYGVILAGEAILFESTSLVAYAVVFAILAHVYVIRIEERGLHQRFGASYQDYREKVPRWFPRRPG